MTPNARPPGFILLMTLILLALVAVLLAQLSRQSVARAAEATWAHDDLQRYWGAVTCRTTLLASAEKLLAAAPSQGDAPTTRLHRTLRLGHQTFEITLADEQAKANVNRLHARLGQAQAAQVVRRLLPSAMLGAAVTLRPSPPPAEGDPPAALPAFGAWAQVFADADPPSLFGHAERPAGLTDALTCWGDGRVNIHRASAAVIKAVAQPTLDSLEVQRLIAARDARPQAGVPELLTDAGVAEDAAQELSTLLTDTSQCYTVAITIVGPHRITSELTIQETIPPSPGDGESTTKETPQQEEQRRVWRLVW